MKIAVIGWGSLIWCPGELSISSRWHRDGPLLPIEFSRVSQDGRLTLVIAEGASKVRALWGLSAYDDLSSAISNLAKRERTVKTKIGSLLVNESFNDQIQSTIGTWALEKSMDGALWTALPPKKPGTEDEQLLSEQEAINYIESLSGEKRNRAEEYVRNTPEQVETRIRCRFRQDFGWENNRLPQVLFED